MVEVEKTKSAGYLILNGGCGLEKVFQKEVPIGEVVEVEEAVKVEEAGTYI